jgi:hypothetical protein
MAEHAAQYEPEQDARYASFETAEGDLVLYDRDDPTAWLQSDTVVTADV